MSRKEKKGKSARKRINWHRFGMFPGQFGFCPSREVWDYEMSRMQVNHSFPASDGRTTTVVRTCRETGVETEMACIITISESVDRKLRDDVPGVAALVAYEAAHVVQEMFAFAGEDNPGTEAEAYAVQMVTAYTMRDYIASGRWSPKKGNR